MNFLDIRAGEPIEVGVETGFRFWRYRFSRDNRPISLVSWVSEQVWDPLQAVEAPLPDDGENGIHAYKSMDALISSVDGDPTRLVFRSMVTGCDGVVLGTVALWGIVWQHTRGYRGQFAQPTSFVSSYGTRSKAALLGLRASFGLG
jgi:hypothetical protein